MSEEFYRLVYEIGESNCKFKELTPEEIGIQELKINRILDILRSANNGKPHYGHKQLTRYYEWLLKEKHGISGTTTEDRSTTN